MTDFWNNIFRYPRFFISSLMGLILVILTPFKNLLKVRKLRVLVIGSLVVFTILIFIIIKSMVGL